MDAIAVIYDALDGEEALAVLPERLAAALGERSAILQLYTPDWDVRAARASYFTPQMVDRYVALELFRIDPWRLPGQRSPNRMITADETVPVETVRESAFFHENFRYWGDDTGRCMGGVFTLPSGFGTIGLHRAITDAPFAPETVAAADPVIPHLRRLFEMRDRLGAADARVALSEAALDTQADAVFVVDMSGRPQLMNRQAQDLLARQDVFVLTRVGLRASHDAASRALVHAIVTACTRQGPQGGALRMARPAGPPLRVLVSPVGAGPVTHALVVVNDPARVDPRHVENLRGYYGLSVAEAEIALSLASGLTPVQTAEQRGVSLPTIRTQIRQALRKTEARGIPELVALVASTPSRVDASR